MSSGLYRIERIEESKGRKKRGGKEKKRKSAWSGILPGQRMLNSCVFNDGGKRRRDGGWMASLYRGAKHGSWRKQKEN